MLFIMILMKKSQFVNPIAKNLCKKFYPEFFELYFKELPGGFKVEYAARIVIKPIRDVLDILIRITLNLLALG